MDKTPNPVYRMDYSKKILACDYHANSNTIAAATLNSFFTYSLSNC